MNYESPVKLYMTDVQSQLIKQQEELILQAVRKVAVGVDHEELFRALRYDRDQYEKGYRDAKAEIVHCEDCWKWYPYNNGGSHDCPYCGYPNADFYCGEGDRKTE